MKLERRVKRNSVKTRYISIESPPFRCNPEKKSKEKNKTNKFIKEEKEKKNPTTRSDRPADVEERKWTRFFCIYLSFGDFFLPFGRRDVAIFILLPRKAKSNNENKSRRGRCFFFHWKGTHPPCPSAREIYFLFQGFLEMIDLWNSLLIDFFNRLLFRFRGSFPR